MGDRVNVKVIFEEWDKDHEEWDKDQKFQPIYMYSHWGGHRMAETVRQALARKQRWNDANYLCRIIFSEMLRRGTIGGTEHAAILPEEGQAEALADECGFGIGPYECDPENPTITVDTGEQTVEMNGRTFSFKAYIKMTAIEVTSVHLKD